MSDSEKKPSKLNVRKILGEKPLLIVIVAVAVCILAVVFIYFAHEKSNFVKTQNASVQYDMITIASKMSGDILDIKVKQGDYVNRGDVIMELNPTAADSSQIDNSYIRSTVDGIVLKTIGAPGQSVATGQTVAYVARDSEMFIISNIDEKEINRIKIGQDVDITLDQFGRQKFYGKVIEVGSATLSAFSVVPSSSSGTFIKTTQYAPVKIQFIEPCDALLAGSNATVRIHVK